MLYEVSYTETLMRSFIVEAESSEAAREKLIGAIEREDVVLTSDDYAYGEIDDVRIANEYEIGAYKHLDECIEEARSR